MSAPAVRVRGLSVSAGGRTLLGPLDLEIAVREHVLLVGPSGSGKSTLLRALAGLVAPDAGTVELFGQPASAPGAVLLRPEHRGVGYLFQGGALWPHLDVQGTLAFVLSARRVPRRERRARIARLIELCELSGLERRRPATLSGGEAQRLALARALAVEPRLLLLDEPLGPLDAELRAALMQRLAEVERRLELTTVHVTHDPSEARELATRTARLVQGKLQEERS